MKKAMIFCLIFIHMILIVIGCNKKEEQHLLTRVDVQQINAERVSSDVKMIVEQTELTELEDIFNEIEWESNVKIEMSRREDIKATFFYEIDKNMPERLAEYRIWFHEESGTAELTSNIEKESYGKLNRENAEKLKALFLP
ncbi:hypothetical protein [Bacillus sp. FSL K6-3431]|uniref:hypothetical protein n=1 Tax=Bacillus sp. FSL K6-3431 TaxID=2921500 RepID=UPI0030F4C7C7